MVRREWALRGEIYTLLHHLSLTVTVNLTILTNHHPTGKVRTSYLHQNTIKRMKYCNIKMLCILKVVKVYYVEIAKLFFVLYNFSIIVSVK